MQMMTLQQLSLKLFTFGKQSEIDDLIQNAIHYYIISSDKKTKRRPTPWSDSWFG